jgi:beta-phosphoglucomutase-like phosphatase (HAD superfamily)
VLDAAGLGERFEVVVDGAVAAAEHISGKPAPDMYLEAARRIGVAPDRSVVVEDAVSGVAAGAAGRFDVVIGVDRGAGADTLLAHGATFVVDDLADLLPDGPTSGPGA